MHSKPLSLVGTIRRLAFSLIAIGVVLYHGHPVAAAQLTSHIARLNRRHVDHAWKLIAQDDDNIYYVDLLSIRNTKGLYHDFWLLGYPIKSTSKKQYRLMHMNMNCISKTAGLIEGFSYDENGNAIVFGRTSQLTIPPESLGERDWLFICKHDDKYSHAQVASTIQEAMRYRDSLINLSIDYTTFINDDDLNNIAISIISILNQSGISGVEEEINKCYKKMITMSGLERQKYAVYCVVFDLSAFKFDKSVRAEFAKRLGHAVSPGLWFDNAVFEKRISEYSRYTTENFLIPNSSPFYAMADRVLEKGAKLPLSN